MSEKNIAPADLEKTMKSLLDTVEATSLAKGGVENSGTYGSEGKQGGGQGSESDAGPIDNMMIAKMIQSGVDVQTAAKFAAFMSGEGYDEDEDDEEMMGKKKARKSLDPSDSDLAKSFRDSLDFNLDAAGIEDEMVDITPYLNGFTEAVGESLGKLDVSFQKSAAKQDKVNKALALAVHQMGTLVKSQSAHIEKQGHVINALGERLGLVEKAPVAQPKGAQTKAQAIEKSMPGEAGGGDEKRLTKSEVLSVLSYKNLVKGEKMIGQRLTSDVITGLESAGIYDREIDSAAHSFFKSLTKEEQAEALRF